jgi:hypothetical protein
MSPISVVGFIILIAGGGFLMTPRGAGYQAGWNRDNQNPLAPGTRPTSTTGVRVMGAIMLSVGVFGAVLALVL